MMRDSGRAKCNLGAYRQLILHNTAREGGNLESGSQREGGDGGGGKERAEIVRRHVAGESPCASRFCNICRPHPETARVRSLVRALYEHGESACHFTIPYCMRE